jgi:3-dehydroquinate dehydratase-2
MAKLLLLNGPNLNLLGTREPAVYGSTSLSEIASDCQVLAERLGHELVFFQSNAEHELVEHIHRAQQTKVAFILFNPAAFTHTSIALRDALLAVDIPFIEVHLTNVFTREVFRHHSYLSDVAVGVISGLGAYGYQLAVQAAHRYLSDCT